MLLHVYRLRSRGQPVAKDRWPTLAPVYGDLTLLQSTEHWGQLMLIARLCIGGADVLPRLEGVELARLRVKRGLVLTGQEAGARYGEQVPLQTWLCTAAPILPHEWAGHSEEAPA